MERRRPSFADRVRAKRIRQYTSSVRHRRYPFSGGGYNSFLRGTYEETEPTLEHATEPGLPPKIKLLFSGFGQAADAIIHLKNKQNGWIFPFYKELKSEDYDFVAFKTKSKLVGILLVTERVRNSRWEKHFMISKQTGKNQPWVVETEYVNPYNFDEVFPGGVSVTFAKLPSKEILEEIYKKGSKILENLPPGVIHAEAVEATTTFTSPQEARLRRPKFR